MQLAQPTMIEKLQQATRWKKNAIACLVGVAIGTTLVASIQDARPLILFGSLSAALLAIPLLATRSLRELGVAALLCCSLTYAQSMILNYFDESDPVSTALNCGRSDHVGQWTVGCRTLMTSVAIPPLEGGKPGQILLVFNRRTVTISTGWLRSEHERFFTTRPPTSFHWAGADYVWDEYEVRPERPVELHIGGETVQLTKQQGGTWSGSLSEAAGQLSSFDGSSAMTISYLSVLQGPLVLGTPVDGLSSAWSKFRQTTF